MSSSISRTLLIAAWDISVDAAIITAPGGPATSIYPVLQGVFTRFYVALTALYMASPENDNSSTTQGPFA
jgi:hypothetical protein